MDREALITHLSEELDWQPTRRGGIAVPKAEFEACLGTLKQDERLIASSLVFENPSKSMGGMSYFAGLPKRLGPVGKRGEQLGAAGYAFHGSEFVMGPNVLTNAIRRTNKAFQRIYADRMQQAPADLSLEDAVNVIASVPGWRMEEREVTRGAEEFIGTAERLAIMPQKELYEGIRRQYPPGAVPGKIIDLLQFNSSFAGGRLMGGDIEVFGQLAEDIGQRVERAGALEKTAAAFDRDPPPHLQGPVEAMRHGLRLGGHLGEGEQQKAEAEERRRGQRDSWRIE